MEALCVLSSNLWVMVVAAVMSVVTDLHDVVLGTAKDTRDLKIVTMSCRDLGMTHSTTN